MISVLPGQTLYKLRISRYRFRGLKLTVRSVSSDAFFNHLEEVELLKVVAEEKPGGALLRHRARAADVQVPQEAAVLTHLVVI